VPGFIKKIATGNIKGSARTILNSNVFGYSCARVCPVEVLCVGACVLSLEGKPPIAIGRLQRYATEPFVGTKVLMERRENVGRSANKGKPSGRKIALVGAGPASIACASYLTERGHKPVIFEKRDVPGGLNVSGIAPYKMHAHDSLKDTEWALSSGIELRTGVEIGKDVSCGSLLEEYDAIFIGIGLGEDSLLGIPGERSRFEGKRGGDEVEDKRGGDELEGKRGERVSAKRAVKQGEAATRGPGIFSAIDMIEKIKLDSTFNLDGVETVAVIGGGNTAIDAARELAHLGCRNVNILYRRTEAEMPGYAHELQAARAAGVHFIEKILPIRLLRVGDNPDGKLKGLIVASAEKARPVPGTEREFAAQMLVVAIGQAGQAEFISGFPGVKSDSSGCVVVDEKTGRTGNTKVFAGGDCVNGGKEVVNAVAEGKRAAIAIDEMLKE